jgi:hypothetical protein
MRARAGVISYCFIAWLLAFPLLPAHAAPAKAGHSTTTTQLTGGSTTLTPGQSSGNQAFSASYNPQTQKVTLVDASNGAVIMAPAPNTKKVYDRSWDFHGNEQPIAASAIQFTPRPDGFDIRVTVTNNTGSPQRVGTLFADGLRLQGDMQFRDFQYFNSRDQLKTGRANAVGNWFEYGAVYPGSQYAPVYVLQGTVAVPDSGQTAEYAIGVSLKYPVLDYQHATFNAAQTVSHIKRVAFHINPKYRQTTGPCGPNDPPCISQLSEAYDAAGDLTPGASRSYEYSVRVMRNPSSYAEYPAQWLRTLEPYREYFQKLYGGPRYAVDRRPVIGSAMAVTSAINTQSPNGFLETRPDLNGWGSTVSGIATSRSRGLERVMLWAPSGMSPAGNNFRYEFTSRWQAYPAMMNSLPQLAADARQHRGLGLWWGRAMSVMTDWNSASMQDFDQRNAAHRAAAFRELDMARAAGATTIGLDDSLKMRSYKAFAWIEEMRLRYPEMKFVAEPWSSDIIHLVAANFAQIGPQRQGTDRSQCADMPLIKPLVLPDFLLQGHETWGYSWVRTINDNACAPGENWRQGTAATTYWYEFVARQGYVPVMAGGIGSAQTLNPVHMAAVSRPSYTTTVPADLRQAYFPKITQQPRMSSCTGGIAQLNASYMSPRGKRLNAMWYFTPDAPNRAAVALPADLNTGFMRPVTFGSPMMIYQGDYGVGMGQTLSIRISPDAISRTKGTYRLRVSDEGGGATWSDFIYVDGICPQAGGAAS